MDTTGAIEATALTSVAISAIIADAAVAARGVSVEARWYLYESKKRKIDRLNPTADEYQRAIALLTEALNI